MSVHIKICGITDHAAAQAAVDAGVDALGFVFADSVRRIPPEAARKIAAELPGHVERVAVFLRPGYDEVARVLRCFRADVVQADHVILGDLGDIRALPVFREGESGILAAYLESMESARFHYEGCRSGVGQTVDWRRASRFASLGRMTIAGGLNPDNVAEVMRVVKPFGLDVSSGVESAPGLKDSSKIRDFVDTVRATEKETASP